jgi:paraquat-inducible protein B
VSIETENKAENDQRSIPRPAMKKSRWPIALVWLVPLAAAVGAGFYFHSYFLDQGPLISVTFSDGTGIRPSDTKVMYRGVEVGQVEDITLSEDHQHIVVSARLHRPEASLARAGTKFWIVRPQVSFARVSGLSTLLSGPYIDLAPGNGAAATQFVGLDAPPQLPEPGLIIHVKAVRIEHLQVDAPVYYRGVEVGAVRSLALGDTAESVELTVLIQPRYATLVRTTSVFWLVKGVDVKGGLFSGVQMKLGSLQALIEGGITFSTPPNDLGQPAASGAEFGLYEDPKDQWVNWAPRILLPPETPTSSEKTGAHLPTGLDAIDSSGSER